MQKRKYMVDAYAFIRTCVSCRNGLQKRRAKRRAPWKRLRYAVPKTTQYKTWWGVRIFES